MYPDHRLWVGLHHRQPRAPAPTPGLSGGDRHGVACPETSELPSSTRAPLDTHVQRPAGLLDAALQSAPSKTGAVVLAIAKLSRSNNASTMLKLKAPIGPAVAQGRSYRAGRT